MATISRTDPTPGGDRFDGPFRATLCAVAGCGAALALGALAWLGPKAGLSAAVGGALAAGNLWVLARIVSALLPVGGPVAARQRRGGALGWTVLALMKMLALFSVVGLLMRSQAISPLPLLLGFAALPLGIAIGSVVSDRSVSGEP